MKGTIMKSLKIFLAGLALMMCVRAVCADDAKPAGPYWYQVTIHDPTYTYQGTSPLADAEFLDAISKGDKFIKVDGLLYRDNSGKYKDWHEWDPTLKGYVYINPKHIVEVKPMVGDPRKLADSGGK
jgi:hypothetical protein